MQLSPFSKHLHDVSKELPVIAKRIFDARRHFREYGSGQDPFALLLTIVNLTF